MNERMRALLKTFRMTTDPIRVQQMRSTIDAVWPIFDDDGSGQITTDELEHIIERLGFEPILHPSHNPRPYNLPGDEETRNGGLRPKLVQRACVVRHGVLEAV